MPHRFLYARSPNRLDARRPLIIEDLLGVAASSKHRCLDKMIEMLEDLHRNGFASRYAKHLFDALYELKDRTRDGGARVYFLRTSAGIVLGRAECKKETAPDERLLVSLVDVLDALEQGKPVLQ
ncbi:MAG TPA: hypothetical protein VHN99_03285 [Deinococcales bacterium]|nr:hypothetical protein [Deinococcales bacterium]